jgi:CheY-like chemotaxis protein
MVARLLLVRDSVPTDHSESQAVLLTVVSRKRSITPILAESGFTVVSAPSGAVALDLIRDVKPDVVMIDADLPDAPSLDICRAMRRDPSVGRDVPIILLVGGKPTPEQRVSALRAGVWEFLTVPGERAEILLKLHTCVEAKRNADITRADSFTDLAIGLHNQGGLTRRAAQLGALMARMHAPFACIVFELDADEPDPEACFLITKAARLSDVVGEISPNRFGVLAPATDGPGAVLLANRMIKAFGELYAERCASRGVPVPHWTMHAGYEAVSNAMYSPIDPAVFIARAATAVRHGTLEPANDFVRRSQQTPHPEDHPRAGDPHAVAGSILETSR